jgi:predicted dehydrogenase
MRQKRLRYALVGLGGRHEMFRDAIIKKYAGHCELVGVCDRNPGRIELDQKRIRETNGSEVPGYAAADFDRMIAETKPDCVIVTSMDATHDLYVCRAMELGCDVITEKPMTTDATKCRRILDTQLKTGRKCTVTFNYRYSPASTQLKQLLLSGVIGEVLSMDFHWMLDLSHGADYFRRWHRNKTNSGGLLVHKATHHFDVINWWLGTVPERVYASGGRRFYTPETADRYGLTQRAERCQGCPEATRCRFFLDLASDEKMRKLYLECETHDGYFRDRCVFSSQIDIEDSMTLVVDYRSGVRMSYSLNAFMPWEGHVAIFNGTAGRLEFKCEETVCTHADGTIPGMLKKEGSWIHIYPNWQPAYTVEVASAKGGHGGADPVMLADIFDPANQPADPLLRKADQRAGAWSILTGVAANESIRQKRPVLIEELVPDLALPDYPTASFPKS